MPLNKDIKKVLVIGSGPIVIGQAAEFDYAGAQACRVLKDEGIEVVLVNSNPATIMTDKALADHIYLEPLTEDTLKRIIEKERPDSILCGLGGQTGLTLGMQLAKDGYLDKMGVKLLGTNAEAIDKAEDRQMFRDTMVKLNQPVVPSDIANDLETAQAIAEKIGYPVIIRPAFTLGGAGGGVANNINELNVIAKNGLMLSPITQVLVEKYIAGWKEIEFEVMRDHIGNVIAVCSMENFDPVGVHTGDSIVIAPAVTLSDKEYQMLRSASLDIISELKIEGGCNCQFALNPETFEYSVIEVNPRVSRSSALASKATGYPIAKVTTKIALGYTLDEIKNDVTGKTCACFEPTLDYVVVKLPKWPFDKFVQASRKLGTQMKATGEVMSIAPSFEMAIMKAVRGAEISLDTLNNKALNNVDITQKLYDQDDLRLFTVFKALKDGISVDKIHSITMIDEWFLYKLKNLADYEKAIENKAISKDEYIKGKQLGYTDEALERISGGSLAFHKDCVYKMVDTCAGEFEAETPYFYSTYDEHCESRALPKNNKEKIIVLGSGPIRIGQGIEFDYSSVHCVWTLKALGYEVILVNNNPETVSTDFDTGDRLYFEPLCQEDVMNIIKAENPIGVVVAFGGQTAIKLTKFLDENGIKILGTSAESIDIAEDRERFDELLESFGISRPKGESVMTIDEAKNVAHRLEYPVLLRPSYVIGGQNMTIAYTDDDVEQYMRLILKQGIENPVLVDKYMMGTELEVDCISDGKDVLIPGIMEHIERAGVHSGDSIAVYPPYNLNDRMLERICEVSEKLALSLKTQGLVNIQYLIYQNELYVIEVNPRASRTIPYISKVTGVPMVELATKIMVGSPLKELGYGTGLYKTPPYFAVKVPVFSFEKLNDVNSQLGPEMKSTGEVLGIGKNLNEALFKGLVSAGFKVNAHKESKGVFITVTKQDRYEIVNLAKKLDDLGAKIYATPETANEIKTLGIDVETVNKLRDDNSIMELIESGKIDYIIYTGKSDKKSINDYIRLHNRANQLGIATLTSLDTANALADIIASKYNQNNTELVDINNMRKDKGILKFSKMQGTGDDYIFFNNQCGIITCPESFSIEFCDRHYSIGASGIVLIESSEIADAKMRIFNLDGSEGNMAGNCIRCVAKYLFDNDMVKKEKMSIETNAGIKHLKVFTRDSKVTSAAVQMGKAELSPAKIPVNLDGDKIINKTVNIADSEYNITCVSVGNPHAVVFVENVDKIDIHTVGPKFENADIFPERVNTEFVRVINSKTIKMRVWERGNGETMACGTGACAAVVAAVENGYCNKGEDITVKVRGGDLTVNYTDMGITLTGDCNLVYKGEIEY
ncbi:carbamoyl-phosphate synthase large subunit [uncultured Eubacterium sp.]|uniref:carbamoyl-phosphate synthase large subunit n=1 Tax=uncultured Eubacterium sp. TaxID=165185 RepID=UPI0025EE0643|nr:carbamoyl-phosphate synthase large subunit [uncultured Eubacterium sp.]